MVQIPLRRAHRLRAITLASPIKKLRPQPTERAPTAWHTNDEYKNAEASEEASASSAVANASETRILPIPTPRHWLHQSCSYKRVSSVGRFYDGLRAARWRAERFLGLLAARGSGCALKTSRVSCLLITLSSSSAPTSLSQSITPISGRICSWHRVARPAWRAASPIRPDLGFRYTQGSRRASHNPLLLAFTIILGGLVIYGANNLKRVSTLDDATVGHSVVPPI